MDNYNFYVRHIFEHKRRTLNGYNLGKYARQIGEHTNDVIDKILKSKGTESDAYSECKKILKLTETYSFDFLEAACNEMLQNIKTPICQIIKQYILTLQNNTK